MRKPSLSEKITYKSLQYAAWASLGLGFSSGVYAGGIGIIAGLEGIRAQHLEERENEHRELLITALTINDEIMKKTRGLTNTNRSCDGTRVIIPVADTSEIEKKINQFDQAASTLRKQALTDEQSAINTFQLSALLTTVGLGGLGFSSLWRNRTRD